MLFSMPRASVVLLLLALQLLASCKQGLSEEAELPALFDAAVDNDVISIRSLLGTAKFDKVKGSVDCRKPANKKLKACRKPSGSSTKKPPTKKPPAKKPPTKKPPTKRPPPPKKSPPPPPPKKSPPPVPSKDSDYTYEAPSLNPTPVPSPPARPPVTYNQVRCDFTPRRRILSGPRLVPNGGLRACTGLHVADAGACCNTCRNTQGCNGWMYTRPLDCRMFGEPNPQNVCYMLSDTTGSYDPAMPELEYQSGTAFY